MLELNVQNVKKTYGATTALTNGNIKIKSGEIHVLIGSNGSGKSTLCKIISGSVKPDCGLIELNGKKVKIDNPSSANRIGVGVYYQELSLFNNRTIAENILINRLPTKHLLIDKKNLKHKAQAYIQLFESVSGTNFKLDNLVKDLREDQRQIVEILKTLATECPILIFDEPTSSLDKSQVDQFFKILTDLKMKGVAIIFISHRMDEIFNIADLITILKDGRTIDTFHVKDIDQSTLISLMTGNDDKHFNLETERNKNCENNHSLNSKLSMKIQNLNSEFFDDINIEINKGEILGLGGLHGHGQSHLLRILFGLEDYTADLIELDGKKIQLPNPKMAISHKISYISGDRIREGVITDRSIFENLTPIHLIRNNIFNVKENLRLLFNNTLESLSTKFYSLDQSINSLSGGNQQKVIISRWLLDEQKILLLDDPTKGIDLAAKSDLFKLIKNIADQGVSIILYSSDDNELLNNADRILVFNNYKLIQELKDDKINRFDLYEATFKGEF